MDPLRKEEYARLLLSLVPESGANIGNVSLRNQLQERITALGDALTDEEYWPLRDYVIDQGLIEQGRGRGGSVHRVAAAPPAEAAAAPEVIAAVAEADLYEPFHAAVRAGYTKVNRIKRFISEITARQGRRSTGGKWTRPDVTLIAVRTYQFATPNKRIEVITFEVKPDLDTAFEGIFEALAHSAFAHRSYLAVKVPEGDDEIADDRIVGECTRHGMGYITFTNEADYETYDIVVGARLNEPDPENVDNFVKTQISQEKQEDLSEFLR
jgi:hypothetical protein